eukprot:SAG31_NODE_1106_length_9878_cov_4.621331_2_plen_88_part_00
MRQRFTARYRIGDENITGRKAAEFRCVSTWLDVYAHLLFVATARIKTVLAHVRCNMFGVIIVDKICVMISVLVWNWRRILEQTYGPF